MPRRATALYDCVGADHEEISFKDGQILFDGVFSNFPIRVFFFFFSTYLGYEVLNILSV